MIKKIRKKDNITKEIRALLNHISLINRKCKEQNLWLMASIDPYKALNDQEQQGPLVTKLYDMAKTLRQHLNKK